MICLSLLCCLLCLQFSLLESVDKLKTALDSTEYQFRFDAGVCVPAQSVTFEQKSVIVQSLIKHYLVHVCKSELEQFKQGCSELGVLDLFCSYPVLFRPLLIAGGKPKLTAKEIASMFQVQWSPQGSNQRETEEAVILGWLEYLDGVEGRSNNTAMILHPC